MFITTLLLQNRLDIQLLFLYSGDNSAMRKMSFTKNNKIFGWIW